MGIGVLSSHWKADGVAIYEPAAEIKTLRMNERGGYTEYTFTNYKW